MGGGGGGGRRHNEPAHNSIRTKPNVFLRQPSRNSSYETSGGGGGGASSHPNQFIHHPRLQNDRQSVPITVARPVAVSRPVAVTTNIHDIEQFPTLSSGSTVLNTSSKLNFKEMVLKNTTAAATQPVISPVEVMPVAPQKYSPVVSQKTLSSGNIFLSAFYGSSGGDDGGGGDGDGGGGDGDGGGGGGYDSFGGGGGGVVSSSVLVDSCDRKYDNLYKY